MISQAMHNGSRRRSILSRMVRRVIMALYRKQGWRLVGEFPDLPKYVVVGAPHTSNWDFVFFIGATAENGVEPSYLGKHTLFKWPLRRFMLDMGGVPIDRSRRANVVEQVAEEFARRDKLRLVIAPEGTRTTDGSWKSGFYHIALAAGVPIVAAYVDNARREIGFSKPTMPSGNFGADLLKFAQFMRAHLPEEPRFAVLEAQARRAIEHGTAGDQAAASRA